MAKKPLFITRTEAAEMCGVNPQTITNWGKAGFIKMSGDSKCSLVNRKSLEQWVKCDDNKSIIDKSKELCEYEREIDRMIIERAGQYERIKEEKEILDGRVAMIKVRGDYMRMVNAGMFEDLVERLICLNEHDDTPEDYVLKARLKEIIRNIANGSTVYSIAECKGLSQARVRQLFYRGINRLINSTKFWQEYITKERPQMIERLARQKSHIVELEREISSLRKVADIKKSEQANILDMKIRFGNDFRGDLNGTDVQRLIWLMQTSSSQFLYDNGISVRTITCIKCNEIDTMYDLVTYDTRELLKMRNFGRKSLCELREFLEQIGLSLGMYYAGEMVDTVRTYLKYSTSKGLKNE